MHVAGLTVIQLRSASVSAGWWCGVPYLRLLSTVMSARALRSCRVDWEGSRSVVLVVALSQQWFSVAEDADIGGDDVGSDSSAAGDSAGCANDTG